MMLPSFAQRLLATHLSSSNLQRSHSKQCKSDPSEQLGTRVMAWNAPQRTPCRMHTSAGWKDIFLHGLQHFARCLPTCRRHLCRKPFWRDTASACATPSCYGPLTCNTTHKALETPDSHWPDDHPWRPPRTTQSSRDKTSFGSGIVSANGFSSPFFSLHLHTSRKLRTPTSKATGPVEAGQGCLTHSRCRCGRLWLMIQKMMIHLQTLLSNQKWHGCCAYLAGTWLLKLTNHSIHTAFQQSPAPPGSGVKMTASTQNAQSALVLATRHGLPCQSGCSLQGVASPQEVRWLGRHKQLHACLLQHSLQLAKLRQELSPWGSQEIHSWNIHLSPLQVPPSTPAHLWVAARLEWCVPGPWLLSKPHHTELHLFRTCLKFATQSWVVQEQRPHPRWLHGNGRQASEMRSQPHHSTGKLHSALANQGAGTPRSSTFTGAWPHATFAKTQTSYVGTVYMTLNRAVLILKVVKAVKNVCELVPNGKTTQSRATLDLLGPSGTLEHPLQDQTPSLLHRWHFAVALTG